MELTYFFEMNKNKQTKAKRPDGKIRTAARTVHDSMGPMRVPAGALYGAQTMRAVANFPVSGTPVPREFINAVLQIKIACAQTNAHLQLLSAGKAKAIEQSALALLDESFDDQFPVDIFQTGSGTSTNMNCNEVIAELASRRSGLQIHPNNDVNMGQSSNDVIPTALSVASVVMIDRHLLAALKHLAAVIRRKASRHRRVVKTGRTHLMDAMPLTLAQEMGAWAAQINDCIDRIGDSRKRLAMLAQGATAIGSGINSHPRFAGLFITRINRLLKSKFSSRSDKFSALSCQDSAVEMSGQLNTLAVAMMKIANDLRWMNSGPMAGLGEISLPALQPGSSIMPGKVNPVIPESACMVCAAVMGNHTCLTVAGQSGNFQLNVMLPLIGARLLESIRLLGNSARLLADSAIDGFAVNRPAIENPLKRNPILVTALNSVCGYDLGARIAKSAYESGRPVIEVASEMTNLSISELEKLLDPLSLTGQER